MENRRPPRRSCKEIRSGWGNRRPGRRNCKETRSGWKIGGLEGVVEEERDLDQK